MLTARYHTVMEPVVSSLHHHIVAATAREPGSPDETAFRQQMLPQLTGELASAAPSQCCVLFADGCGAHNATNCSIKFY